MRLTSTNVPGAPDRTPVPRHCLLEGLERVELQLEGGRKRLKETKQVKQFETRL